MANQNRITILLNDEERVELDRRRGLATMTAYIKKRLFEDGTGSEDRKDVQRVDTGLSAEASVSEKCSHGYTKGNCPYTLCRNYGYKPKQKGDDSCG